MSGSGRGSMIAFIDEQSRGQAPSNPFYNLTAGH
jgi:hypothetical protein